MITYISDNNFKGRKRKLIGKVNWTGIVNLQFGIPTIQTSSHRGHNYSVAYL